MSSCLVEAKATVIADLLPLFDQSIILLSHAEVCIDDVSCHMRKYGNLCNSSPFSRRGYETLLRKLVYSSSFSRQGYEMLLRKLV